MARENFVVPDCEYSRGFIMRMVLAHSLPLEQAEGVLHDVVIEWASPYAELKSLSFQDGCNDADYFATCL